jgi:hypothetical protein
MADEKIPIDRAYLDQAVELIASAGQEREAGQQEGAREAVQGYERGWLLGHDTGYGAREDTRSFVHGLLAGFEAGNQERKELTKALLAQSLEHKQPEYDYEMGE